MDGLRGVNRAFSLGDPSALLALRNLHKITASNLNTRGGLSNRRPSLLWVIFDQVQRGLPVGLFRLEPIQEEWIHEQRFGLVKRLSMMRIIARRTKAATVPA